MYGWPQASMNTPGGRPPAKLWQFWSRWCQIFSLATPNKNHGWVTLILYEHPRRPSTSEILTIFGLRSGKLEKLFLTGFFVDAILFFGRKTSVVEVFQHYVWKINLCLCPDTSTDSRWSTLIFKSKILPIVYVEDIPVKASMPNLVQLYQKTLLEKLFLTWFFGVYE